MGAAVHEAARSAGQGGRGGDDKRGKGDKAVENNDTAG